MKIDSVKLKELIKQNKADKLYQDSVNASNKTGNINSDTLKLHETVQQKNPIPQNNPVGQTRKDSLKGFIAYKRAKLNDSLSKVKKRPVINKKIEFGGTVSNQFDYGAIPYYIAGNSFPANLYKSSGSVNVRAGKIPLIADYFYSNPKFISGLNNYFTVRFDAAAFQEIRNKDYLEKASALKPKLDSLSLQNQKLKQQLALLEMQRLKKISAPNSFTNVNMPDLKKDSLNIHPGTDSLKYNMPMNAVDSLKNLYSGLDTSLKNINAIKEKVETNQKSITALQQKISAVENPQKGISPKQIFPQNKVLDFLEGVKKFEVGMCYPSYSTFMINQMAIKGINTKYELKHFFINASAGKTVINYSIQPTNSAVLNQIQNLTSLFDWNKNPVEKKIVALKTGVGKENKNYIAIGGLYGRGTTSPNTTEAKNNFVIEIDGRYIYKFLNFEAAIAKSFLTDNKVSPLNTELAGNDQGNNWNRSLQGKLYGTVPKIKTKFSFTYRVVEPYFKSFGVGFMRSDIKRYDLKLEQPFGSKIKAGFNYRKDEDNLKGLFSYKTFLENYTYYAKIRLLKKRMDVTLNYTGIIQRINNLAAKENKIIRSNIKTGIVSYSPKFRKLQSTNTIICNIYELSDGFQKNSLENYSFSSFNQYRKWQLNSLNSFIHNTIKDSLNFTNAMNNTIEVGYEFSQKLRVLIGGKHAYELTNKLSQFGYSATVSLKLHKLVNVEFKAEKLVLGDFINTLNYSGIQQFPYYGYIKIVSVF